MMKNTKWLIQTSGFQSSYLEITFETLKKLQIKVEDFGLFSQPNYENIISNIENCLENNLDTNYIIRGGTKILRIINNIDTSNFNTYQLEHIDIFKQKLKEAINYDVVTFDQLHYSKMNLPLLNDDSIYMPFEECNKIKFDKPMFIKPCRDLKAFNGGILPSNITVNDYIINNYHQSFYNQETIVLSSLKNIINEYRFFVIEDTIITGSLYKHNQTSKFDSYIPKHILNVAKEYCKLYQPSSIFVMDLAETINHNIYIIEYNCWNASGLYACDIQKLFFDINSFKQN